jgi:hypothetical protein
MPLLDFMHHPPIPAPNRVESHQDKQLHLKATIIARLSILILSKTYPTKVTSRHVGFWLVGLFAKKLLGSGSLLSHFSSCSGITITR